MSAMGLRFFVLRWICVVAFALAVEAWREPSGLAPYQDVSKCGWEGSPWYVLYRSVEGSQFGKDARCINGLQVTPLVNDTARIRFRYTPDGEKYASFHVRSSLPGGPKNILELKLEEEGSMTVPFDVLYSECGTCQVIKYDTPDRRRICMQYIPAEAFDKDLTHCHFIYNLECGHLPKYHISDKSCLSQGFSG